MIDISRSFSTSALPIQEFFERGGIGFYIPLYQRPYSWGEYNISQLTSDISNCVEMTLVDSQAIRFMGTVILVKDNDPENNIEAPEPLAIPSRVDHIIDGQQRISTFALLACLLYQRLQYFGNLPSDPWFQGLADEMRIKRELLQEMFSIDLRRGSPRRKPIVIRGSEDTWTEKDSDDKHYKSEVTSYLAAFIRSINDQLPFPGFPDTESVGANLRQMNIYLLECVEKANLSSDPVFPSAQRIIEKMSQIDLWGGRRPELVQIIENMSTLPTDIEQKLCSIIQLLAFCHVLLRRCCFTVIVPVSESGAFDMFQSLNATGTPLTVIETFKPMVYKSVRQSGSSYRDSKSEEYFDNIDNIFNDSSTSDEKDKLTKEYVTLFAVTHDGYKLPASFSEQRRWLTKNYEGIKDLSEREEFVHCMSDLALYWKCILGYSPNTSVALDKTDSVPDPERKEAAFSILYLKDAGHTMANSILSRFYAMVLRKKAGSAQEFVMSCRAVAAFYTLWRASMSNSGLDEVYRRLLEQNMSWKKKLDAPLLSSDLKAFLQNELMRKGVGNKTDWMIKASRELRYDSARPVCKFALFIASHDTIADPLQPGLMKMGTHGAYPYLLPDKWRHSDFKSIEHIAPQRPEALQELP
jgi:hypothetical protein